MVTKKLDNLVLTITFQSFSISSVTTGEILCSGTRKSFNNKHDDMRKYSLNMFDKLTKLRRGVKWLWMNTVESTE